MQNTLKQLEEYNKTAARVIRGQLETVEEDAVRDVRRIVSAVIEDRLRDCSGNNRYATSCNKLAKELDEAVQFEEDEIRDGLQKELPLGVRSALEGIAIALRMASRTNTKRATRTNSANRG